MTAGTRAGTPSLTWRTVSTAGGLVLGSAAHVAQQAAVLGFLGHLGGPALYLRSLYTPFGMLSLAIGEGLVVAVQVTASSAAARGGSRDGRGTIGGPVVAMTVLGAGGFVLVASGMWAFGQPLAAALGVPQPQRADAVVFLVAMVAAQCALLLPALAGGVLRGLGRTHVSGVLAVGETLLVVATVYGVHAVSGLTELSVPVGTAAVGLCCGVLAWGVVGRAGVRPARPALSEPTWQVLRQVALPIGASYLVLSGTALGYLWLLREAGPVDVAAFGVVQTLQALVLLPAIAIGSATAITTTLAGDVPRTAALGLALRVALPTYLVVAGALLGARDLVVGALVDAPDVHAAAVGYLAVLGPPYLLLGTTLAVLTYLEQSGDATAALLVNAGFFGALLLVGAAQPAPLHAGALTAIVAWAQLPGFVLVLGCATWLVGRRPA
ncbi:hypothetical protein [Pseudonocardia sp. TRM90224]|uniref:hypothetical protein n=1 Tax=Pseudonocardia sp. TRM90224 TaxID=2812678 RepID=UPI001E409767|nr:hypothetical protein [Pseudonocardia sp. TRM90224]